MTAEEVRVVLVKPGDTLLIGNIGQDLTPETLELVMKSFAALGLDRVVMFAEDIDIAKVP